MKLRPDPLLDGRFLTLPVTHRALHDQGAGRPENSLSAIRAAVAAGYGVEVDVQISADDCAMVFHDAELDRMTEATGPIRDRPADALDALALAGSAEGIPRLATALDAVSGQAPLLLELKDQSGWQGGTDGRLEAAVAETLTGYGGPVAVMSFNAAIIARMADLAPHIPRGLVTSGYLATKIPDMSAAMRHDLSESPALGLTGASFISHDRRDLDNPRVAEIKAMGVPILTWTVRSPEEEAEARRVADNITFEGYRPRLPAPD